MVDNDGGLRVGRRLVIPQEELEWSFSSVEGPAGSTPTRLTRESTSGSISPTLLRLAPSTSQVVGTDRPGVKGRRARRAFAGANRQIALERLAQRLEEALRVERPRRPTRPTEASRQRRLRDKQARSVRKQERRSPLPEP